MNVVLEVPLQQILGLTVFLISVGTIVYLTFFYRPTTETNSWGDPDAGEACGYCILMLLAVVFFMAVGVCGLILFFK